MGELTIREARQRLGLTQVELADRTGLDQTTVSGYETGDIGRPRRATLRKLARALRCRMDALRFPADECGAAS